MQEPHTTTYGHVLSGPVLPGKHMHACMFSRVRVLSYTVIWELPSGCSFRIIIQGNQSSPQTLRINIFCGLKPT